jgi:hypothetical protein
MNLTRTMDMSTGSRFIVINLYVHVYLVDEIACQSREISM